MGYIYKVTTATNTLIIPDTEVTETSVMISVADLIPDTPNLIYAFSVAAQNSAGIGPFGHLVLYSAASKLIQML